MECNWKDNWFETKENFRKWWNREGLVLGGWYGLQLDKPKENIDIPPEPGSIKDKYLNAEYRSKTNHFRLANTYYPLDILPIAETNIAPGALALFLGAQAEFSNGAVWLKSSEKFRKEPEQWDRLQFDEENIYWQRQEEILRECKHLSEGKYIVGLTDLVQNIDTLDTLRGTNNLMMDFMMRPDWLKEKITEVTNAWFEAYNNCYDIIKLDDGSMAVDCFRIFAPGKTAMLQCDASGMISEDMYNEFVLPSVKEQCKFLDYSVYHVDGPDALRHLDSLLDIDELDAIEWTPGPQVPQGGDKEWYKLYGKILGAGKAVQAVNVKVEEIIPMLYAVGIKGLYIIANFTDQKSVDFIINEIEKRF